MRRYPIGIQDFREIHRENSLYIDKTELIYQLISTGKYYFLSRPRRFGKSLLLSTLKELFSGNRELFDGLWIEDKWDWKQKYPVIHLQFSRINYEEQGLYEALKKHITDLAKDLEIELEEADLKDRFYELIKKTSTLGKVVLLVDEYDKPIIDYLSKKDQPIAEENRSIFKSFYSVIKDSDPYIQFLMITGVSKFAKVSIFSDLNNLEDITLIRKMNNLLGITQAELENNFREELTELEKEFGLDRPALLEKIRTWYNGYSWGGSDRLYNPFSLLSFMKNQEFQNFWFQTGTPTFLVKHISQKHEFQFDNIQLGANTLSTFNIKHLASVPLLFQTGYLTIKSYYPDSQLYKLGYPNKEVGDSLHDALLSAYRQVFPGQDSMAERDNLGVAIQTSDIPGLIEALNSLIATIPYDHWKADRESIFHIILHLAFTRLGLSIQSEVHSAHGRCDVILQTSSHIFALELKLDTPAQQALDQILEKAYLAPYQQDPRKKLAVGISFSSEQKKIAEYKVQVA